MEEDDDEAFPDEGLAAFVNFIIRPPRARYGMDDLGPRQTNVNGSPVHREDFRVTNARGQRLECSIWSPDGAARDLPFVVYLHGNASCRAEASMIMPVVQPFVNLVGMDFSGSGMSDGTYISLGYYEKDDVAAVVQHLRSAMGATRIALWGHSMGASTAVMYCGSRPDHHVACAVLDSGYASFDKLADGFVENMQLPPGVPKKMLMSVGLRRVRKIVKDRAGFDLSEVQPAKSAKKCGNVPCVMVHGTNDSIVPYKHAELLFKAYACPERELARIDGGDHDSPRPSWVEDKALLLVLRHLSASLEDYVVALKARANSRLLSGEFGSAEVLFKYIIDLLEPRLALPSPARPANGGRRNARNAGEASPVGTEPSKIPNPLNLFRKKAETVPADADGGTRRRRTPLRGGNRLSLSQSFSGESATPTTPGGSPATGAPASAEAPASSNQGRVPPAPAFADAPIDEKLRGTLSKLLLAVYGNRSLALTHQERGDDALRDAMKALELDPGWVRGYQRQAAALKLVGRQTEAMEALERGLALDGHNQALLELKSSLE